MNRFIFFLILFSLGCNSSNDSKNYQELKENKGIGPITNIVLNNTIDLSMASSGEKLFNQLCTACHMVKEESIGPSISGILDRRSPEWVMNLLLNPNQMLEEDPIAKDLLVEYNNIYMYNQNLIEEEAREILEYFRTLD